MTASVNDARISNKGRVELEISVPPTDIASFMDECEEELALRGGIDPKLGRDGLVARFDEERLAQLVEEWVMDRFGTEMLSASENPLVGFPQFVLVSNDYPTGPFVFQAASYELPAGTLSSDEPVVMGPEAREATDEAIDKALKSLLRAYGARRAGDEVRPVKPGDTVKIDAVVTAGGVRVETFCRKGASLVLDHSTMPAGFVDQIVGMSPGEHKEFTFTTPAVEGIAPAESFDAAVDLKAIFIVDEPKLTTAWIKSRFPGLNTVDDLRDAMAENLAGRAGGLPNKENAIDAALFERLDVEVDDELLDFVVAGIVREESKRAQSQGLDLETVCAANGDTLEEFLAKVRETALRDVKLSVALDLLYAAKGFELRESDIDFVFDQMAPGQAAEMRRSYILSGRLHLAEELAQRAKARRWLDETAKLA